MKKQSLRKRLQRVISAGLCLALVTLAVGCGSEADTAATQPQQTQSQEAEASTQKAEGEIKEITFPLEETVELTIATSDDPVASLANNLPIWQEIERRTNVKINWDVTDAAQYTEVMKLRIGAGGQALPDIMLMPNQVNLAELGGQGRILALEDHLAVNGSAIMNIYERNPMAQTLTSADGHIYSINTIQEGVFAAYGFIIRQDWLDRLGLKAPETVDEWVTVLKAFRDEDANGNGDPTDEIPFTAGGHAWYTTFWANGWGLNLFLSDGWSADENGKVQYDFVDDRAKEFYVWMNEFYEEGLLDPEFLTIGDENKMFEKIARNNVGAFTAYPSQIDMLETALKANGAEDAELVALAPPKGPYAQQVEVLNNVAEAGYVISADCEHPEVAVAFLNYLYDGEGCDLLEYGIEGETYVKNNDGTYSFTELVTNNPDGLSATEVLQSYGCFYGAPYFKDGKYEEASLFNFGEETRANIIEVNDKTKPLAKMCMVVAPATEEETEIIAGKQGDLATYIWEMTGKFIVGRADPETEWEDFVSGVKSLGMEDILSVKQAQYDRLHAGQ